MTIDIPLRWLIFKSRLKFFLKISFFIHFNECENFKKISTLIVSVRIAGIEKKIIFKKIHKIDGQKRLKKRKRKRLNYNYENLSNVSDVI